MTGTVIIAWSNWFAVAQTTLVLVGVGVYLTSARRAESARRGWAQAQHDVLQRELQRAKAREDAAAHFRNLHKDNLPRRGEDDS